MRFARRAGRRWSLADLIDFETVLAASDDARIERDRLVFMRDVQPALAAGDAGWRRRTGLHAWLDQRRGETPVAAGSLWRGGVWIARGVLFAFMAGAGVALVVGLCTRQGQHVHVVVFFSLALLLPWALFVAWQLLRVFMPMRDAWLARLMAACMRLGRRVGGVADGDDDPAVRARLVDGRAPRRALQAAFGGVLQVGALGFNLGLVLAFVGSLLIFDVRFYWEATPQTGALVESSVAAIGAPWAAAWPAAVPSPAQIEASRARFVDGERRLPATAGSTAAWWRFLLMALLVWGVLPRLLLIAVYRAAEHRALATLDFQAPRHRALWRALAGVERGAVAAPVADGALVLDVGGSGLALDRVRGFLLRALRVNPQAVHRVNVLDDTAEADADRALAESPDHVVLLVEDWSLSPRQVTTLHARVRDAAGPRTPMTWLVYARDAQGPTVPHAGHLTRWTRFIDALRDPATEIVGYEPGR